MYFMIYWHYTKAPVQLPRVTLNTRLTPRSPGLGSSSGARLPASTGPCLCRASGQRCQSTLWFGS